MDNHLRSNCENTTLNLVDTNGSDNAANKDDDHFFNLSLVFVSNDREVCNGEDNQV